MHDLNLFLEKNLKKIILVLFIINVMVSFSSVLLTLRCDGVFSQKCLYEKLIPLNSDFYWNYNTIKHVAQYGSFPKASLTGPALAEGAKMYEMWHSPLYYYLAAPVILLANILGISDILLLTIFSIIITILTSLMFLLIADHISRYLKNKLFVLYSFTLFIFLPTHLFFSVSINDDVLFYFFALFSSFIYLKFMEKKTLKNAIFFGLIIGLTLLSKTSGLLFIVSIFFYVLLLQLKREYKERTLILISFLVSILIGVYPLIRNYILFGDFFFVGVYRAHRSILKSIIHLIRAYWGGIFGGLEGADIFVALIALILMFTTFYGVLTYFKSQKDLNLDFIILVGVLNLLIGLNYICGVIELIKTGQCMGLGLQNRYFIFMNPVIAIFSSIALIKFNKKNLYILGFLLFTSLLFSLDFLFAFVS